MNKEKGTIVLSPSQQRAFEELLDAIAIAQVVVLKGRASTGRTTVLRKLQSAAGGALLGMRDFMTLLAAGLPMAFEEACLQMIEQALAEHDLVMVDDLHLLHQVARGCDYARSWLLEIALTAVIDHASALGKRLVFATDCDAPEPVVRRGFSCEIEEFQPEDYRAICEGLLPDPPAAFDYAAIHRFAPALNAQQLSNACAGVRCAPKRDTDSFIEYLRSHEMTSNVEPGEVERVTWNDLKGADHVIRELEARIALPFENDAVRQELGLRPKRGVLLAGPPGTGKTTIGRALAHRLKGKFFLIDGSVVAGTQNFYHEVDRIFDSARRNAPSIVFIDDADVIFEDENNRGFYRYLLTVLDGLESAASERVCVIMTAMHPGALPAAMLRSGRVELWLETRLPDAEARSAILRERLAQLPAPFNEADIGRIVPASDGLTGADLKYVVDDAKLLYAGERARGNPPGPVEEYFLRAIADVKTNRRRYSSSRAPKISGAPRFGFAMN